MNNQNSNTNVPVPMSLSMQQPQQVPMQQQQVPMQQQQVRMRGPPGRGPPGYEPPRPVARREIPDEDALPPQREKEPVMVGEMPPVAMHLLSEFDAVEAGRPKEMFVMATVQAPEAPMETLDKQRQALDLVVVVDRSGSMQGQKIDLVKQTLQLIVKEMGPTDRLSIVPFSSWADILCGLKLTDGAGKKFLSEQVEVNRGLSATGGTDIDEGLRAALSVLKGRKERNSVTSILLLSDGQDRGSQRWLEEFKEVHGVTIHCFGFGTDHDSARLSKIAQDGKGTYTFIEELDVVGPAFGNVLGGLLSIWAQEVTVTANLGEGYSFQKVHSHFAWSYSPPSASVPTSATIILPDLFFGESRDLLFTITVPSSLEQESELAMGCEVSYKRPSKEPVAADTVGGFELRLPRPARVENARPNIKLDEQRNRILTADAQKEAIALAERRDYAGAQETLDAAINAIQASVSGQTPLCVDLLRDLRECKSRCSDSVTYASRGGYMQANMMMHQQQRSAVQRTVDRGFSGFTYARNSMQDRVHRSFV